MPTAARTDVYMRFTIPDDIDTSVPLSVSLYYVIIGTPSDPDAVHMNVYCALSEDNGHITSAATTYEDSSTVDLVAGGYANSDLVIHEFADLITTPIAGATVRIVCSRITTSDTYGGAVRFMHAVVSGSRTA